MASNFRILVDGNNNRNRLHLKLDGEFDENSAHKLINSLKIYSESFKQIFIDTDDLKFTCLLGRDTLQKNPENLKRLFCNLILTGEKLWNQSYLYQWLLWNEAI